MSLRDRLRALPSIVGSAPPFDTDQEHPRTLMVDFLTSAIDAGVPEPHAITLTTVDESGRPDARVLIVKDVDQDGNVAIATSSSSPKARQMMCNPHVALSWYCTPLARAIRIKGLASLAGSSVAQADYQARSTSAKAIAMAGNQSSIVAPGTDRAALIDAAEDELSMLADSGSKEGELHWQVWMITLKEVEFWQGARDRNHDRLRYTLEGDTWKRTTLWP